MKKCSVKMILKSAEIIELDFGYSYVCEIFSRIESTLILRNKTENDILKLIIKL